VNVDTRAVIPVVLSFAALALGGCKSESRASTCRTLRDQTVMVADQMSKALNAPMSSSDRAEIDAKARQLEQDCLKWPPEVLACMRPGADPDSAKCREALATASGKVHADVDHAPDGPAVVATAQLPEAPVFAGYHAQLAADGGLVTLGRDALTAYAADGAQRWRAPFESLDWMLVLDDGTVLTADRTKDDLIAVALATGAEAWRVTPPKPADDEFIESGVEGATRLGDRVVIALADARFYRIDAKACAKRGAACLELMFTLTDETLDDPALSTIGGDLVLGESNAIRRLSPAGKTLASIHVRDSFGGVAALAGDRLAAVLDDELVILDLAACGPTKVALPRKRGRMYTRGEGECDACTAPPPGCVVARPDLGDVDAVAPVALKDGSVLVTIDEGVARIGADGAQIWKSEAPVFGHLREVGGVVVGLASGVGDDLDEAPARVVALDVATGKVAWRRALAVEAGFIVSSDDVVVEATPPWLVVGYKGAVSWLRIP